MALKWMTNMGFPILPDSQEYLDNLAAKGLVVRKLEPKATELYTADQLTAFGMIGIYVETEEVIDNAK